MSIDDKSRRELYPLIKEAIEKGYSDLGCGLDIGVAQAITPNMYNALANAGYRKSTDVAEEIFAEIEREIKNHGICYAQRKIAELKKKYTEEGK